MIAKAQHTMHDTSRHIRRRHNIIRKLISNDIIIVDFINSKDNLAGPLMNEINRE